MVANIKEHPMRWVRKCSFWVTGDIGDQFYGAVKKVDFMGVMDE